MTKKLSCRRIVGSVICIIMVLAVVVISAIYFTQPMGFGGKALEIKENPNLTAMLTKDQVQSDAEQMVSFLEEVHPIFLSGASDAYNKSKSIYMAATQNAMSVSDFRALTSRFLAVLNDGHTGVRWTETKYLKINWTWTNDALVVGNDDVLPPSARIVSIGGIPIDQIIATAESLQPAENAAAHKVIREKYTRLKSILEQAGVGVSDSIVVTVLIDGAAQDFTLKYTNLQQNTSNYSSKPDIESSVENGVFIITLRECNLSSAVDQTITALQDAVKNGCTKIVVDVRDNPGGSSLVCTKILNALGMEPGTYGSVTRFSRPAQEQRGYLRSGGAVTIASNNNAKPNDTLQLRVITNENSFSSATMLAVWTQDGHLGKVVGQPSANMPSSYGDVIMFQLNNSKLYGTVSYKQWTRPDIAKTSEPELVPDILVPENDDAMTVTMRSFS